MKDLVTVIIPTYKRADLLKEAINSVIKQTYKNIEIIVVDDNDPKSVYRKRTEKKINNYFNYENIMYIKHSKNKNGSAARNTGIKNSNGKYIAFLDDDDEFLPNKIEKQINLLKNSSKEYVAVYCRYGRYSNGKKVYESKYDREGNLMYDVLRLRSETHINSTMLIKSAAIKEINGFDTEFDRHQDYEFLIRFFRRYKIKCISSELVKINTESIINRPDGIKLEMVKKKFLKDFEKDIYKFNQNERKDIYSAHYFQLFKVFLNNKNIIKASYYFIKSKPDIYLIKNLAKHTFIKIKEILS